MDDSYNRIVRDVAELLAFRRYIAANPVKARLPETDYTVALREILEIQPCRTGGICARKIRTAGNRAREGQGAWPWGRAQDCARYGRVGEAMVPRAILPAIAPDAGGALRRGMICRRAW